MLDYVFFFTKLPRMNKIVFFIGLIGILIASLEINLIQDAGSISFFDNMHWTFGTFAAAVLSALGYIRNRSSSSSKTSLWFFIGFSGYAIGQIIWDIQVFFAYSGFPSPSDLFYLWLGPSITIALFYEVSLQYEKASRPTFLLDLLALCIAALTLILLSYLPRGAGVDMLSMSVMVSYPIMLIIPVIMLVLMIPSMRLSINANLSFFLIGITITAWSWMHWNSMALDGLTTDGAWSNILFSISILMAGLAVSTWHLSISKNKKYDRFCEASLRILPIITVVLSSIAIITVGSDTLSTLFIKELVYFGVGIVVILAIIRQSYLLHDSDSLQKETLDRLSLATIHNGIGIWDLNLQTKELVWDDSMFSLYNIRREDFSGAFDAWEKSLHPDDKEASKEALSLAASGETPFDTEFRVIWPTGEIRHIKAVAKVFFDDKGKGLRMLGTNVDITKLRVAEGEIIKKDNLLIVQSRLVQMGEMISMIAHQWRQPLSAISANSIKLQVKLELAGKGKIEPELETYFIDNLKGIDRFVQSLTTTIDDFRNFYKPNKKPENIFLEDIVKDSLEIVQTSLDEMHITIKKEYESLEKVNVFRNELMQVILNIIKNAEDNFTQSNIVNPVISIKIKESTISICDNGNGIPEDIIDNIFDPYFSTKDSLNGTGLGLYMSKTIVEEHHKGKLQVINKDGGACFIISLGTIT